MNGTTTSRRIVAIASRQLEVRTDTFDRDKRTFDLVLSTGARVMRTDWWTGERWFEELSLEDGHVRMDRMRRGIAFLMEHGFTTLADSQIGVLTNPRIERDGKGGRELVLTARMSKRDEVRPIADDIADGIRSFVSVGYKTWAMEERGDVADLVVRTAIDWEPLEGSSVSIPADVGASVRGGLVRGGSLVDSEGHPIRSECEVVIVSAAPPGAPATRTSGGQSMGEQAMTAASVAAEAKAKEGESARAAAQSAPTTAPASSAEQPDAGAIEQRRQKLIRELTRKHSLPADFSDRLADGKFDERGIKDAVLDHLAQKAAPAPSPVTRVGAEQRDHLRAGMMQALEVKVGLKRRRDCDDRARRFLGGVTMLRMCEEYLRHEGVEIESLDAEWIGKRAFAMIGTSDLPKLFQNVQEKSLQNGYDSIPTTWRNVARVVPASDFKTRATVHRGLGSKLQKVLESGEIPMGKFAEGGETYKVESWGLIVPFTFQALRNDDLDAIGETPRTLGVQAALNVDENLWAFVSGNATMADTVALFHAASHANDVAGGSDYALGGSNAEKGLTEMQRLLRVQTDDDGLTKLGTPGQFLIVPAALDVPARKNTAQIMGPTATSGVNVFSFLTPLVVPHLDGGTQGTARYYMAANPAIRPTFEVAFLDGNEMPIIDSEASFEQDGLRWRVRWYWGGVVPNHRGIVRNIGQTA